MGGGGGGGAASRDASKMTNPFRPCPESKNPWLVQPTLAPRMTFWIFRVRLQVKRWGRAYSARSELALLLTLPTNQRAEVQAKPKSSVLVKGRNCGGRFRDHLQEHQLLNTRVAGRIQTRYNPGKTCFGSQPF